MTDALIPLFRSRDHSQHTRMRSDPGMVRVRPGVYAQLDDWAELTPWDRYRHRVLAHHSVSPDAIFSHESAAIIHDLPVFGEPKDIHLFAPHRSSTKRSGDVLEHTSEVSRTMEKVGLVHLTSLADTAVDLGRVLPPAAALAVWDAVLRRGITRAQLRETWVRQTSSRGTRTLTWLTGFADERAESPGESVSRAAIDWLGFPPPDLQIPFDRYRADFTWPHARVVGEFDGWGKYTLNERSSLRSLREEKEREDRIRRTVSGFARWGFADLYEPDRLRDILRAAGLREVRPPDQALLHSLSKLMFNRRSL